MFDVHNRRAIVTGASQGFGLEFTRRMLTAGCKVCMSDISVEKGEKAAAELRHKFGLDSKSCFFVKCDVAVKDDWTNLWDSAEKGLEGKIDILFNNAGVGPTAGWENCVNIMTVGFTRGVFMALERMGRSKGGNGGRIINTASIAGLTYGGLGTINGVGYNISKWGNIALTRNFEAAKPNPEEQEGVKCWALCPWFADTPMVRSLDNQKDKAIQGGAKSVADLERKTGHRILTAEEVGDAMMKTLTLDKSGAVYAMFPDVPLIEYTSIRNYFFYFQLMLAKVAAKCNVETFTPTVFYAFAFVFFWLAFTIFNKVACCLLFGCS